MEKSNREMFDNFRATQEDTMRGFIELEKKRMEWQAEQERKDDARELHFMTFIKEIFSMFAPPPPLPYYPPTQSGYPFSPNRQDEEEVDE